MLWTGLTGLWIGSTGWFTWTIDLEMGNRDSMDEGVHLDLIAAIGAEMAGWGRSGGRGCRSGAARGSGVTGLLAGDEFWARVGGVDWTPGTAEPVAVTLS